MNCPRCGAPRFPQARQCERCGLLFEAYRDPQLSHSNDGLGTSGAWSMGHDMSPNPRAMSRPQGMGGDPPSGPIVSRPRSAPPSSSHQWDASMAPADQGMVVWEGEGGQPSRLATGARQSSDLRQGMFAGAVLQRGRLRVLSVYRPFHGAPPMSSQWIAQDIARRGDRVVLVELPLAAAPPADADRIREIKAASLRAIGDHQALPHFLGSFAEQRRHFLVFAYDDAEFLSDRTQRIGALPERLILVYGEQLLEALRIIERQAPPVVHGLISPGTIVISRDGRFARFTPWAPHIISGTFPDPIPFMPGFSAPETRHGQHEANSDLYSLGATLFFGATNSDVSARSGGLFPLARQLNPLISPAVETMIARTLRFVPGQRYATAQALLNDLERIRNEDSSSVEAILRPQVAARRRRAQTFMVSGGISLLLLVALLVTLIVRQSGGNPASQPQAAATADPLIATLAAKHEGLSTGLYIFDTAALTTGSGCTNPTPNATPTATGASGPACAVLAEQQAAGALSNHNIPQAIIGFQQAVANDRSNPEARIYLADTLIVSTPKPNYVTLDVAVNLSGDDLDVSRQVLLGVAEAQDELNAGGVLPNGAMLRVEIANVGTTAEAAYSIAQIYSNRLMHGNPEHSLGFISFLPHSITYPTLDQITRSLNLITSVHVPVEIPLTTTDSLQKSPYFFRLSPTNESQGTALATIAAAHVKAGGAPIEVVSDSSNVNYIEVGGAVVATLQSQNATDPLSLHIFNNSQPDHGAAEMAKAAKEIGHIGSNTIVYVGNTDGAILLAKALLAQGYNPNAATFPTIFASSTAESTDLIGQGNSAIAQFAQTNQAMMTHLVMLSLADAGTWQFLIDRKIASAGQPTFFSSFGNTFTPPDMPIPLTPSGSSILSYDSVKLAINALLVKYSQSWTARNPPTPQNLRDALAAVQAGAPWQGASGLLAFDAQGLPVNRSLLVKTIVVSDSMNAAGAHLLAWKVLTIYNGDASFCNTKAGCPTS